MADVDSDHYAVTSPNGRLRFGVTVRHSVDGTRDSVWLGARKNKCVVISVYMEADEDDDATLAHIEGISYNRKCAEGNQMPPTTGTFQMVVSAMKFVLLKYPHVRGFTLKDTSTLRCDDGDHVELSYLQFAMYGATWYQRCFGAAPMRGDLDSVSWLAQPKQLPYDQFYRRWIAGRFDRKIKGAEVGARAPLRSVPHGARVCWVGQPRPRLPSHARVGQEHAVGLRPSRAA